MKLVQFFRLLRIRFCEHLFSTLMLSILRYLIENSRNLLLDNLRYLIDNSRNLLLMGIPCEEALLKSSGQKNFDVMGGLVWKQFRYTPKSPKILGLWLADPTGGKRKQ